MDDATRCLNPTKKESCDGPCLTYGFMAKTGNEASSGCSLTQLSLRVHE